MAFPALGLLFTQLARTAIPMLGRGVAGEAAAGAGARAGAGVKSATTAAAGGRLRDASGRFLSQGLAKATSGAKAAGPATAGAAQSAAAAKSAGKVAQSAVQGQQQTASSLSNGLKNTSTLIRDSLKQGFRDIAKNLDMSALFQQQAGPNQQRQADIAGLKQQIAGHGSMMGQSLAPSDMQSKLADLEAMEAKDQAAREEANEQVKQAATALSKSLLLGVGALSVLPGIGKKFAEAMVAANEGLRQFNGQIANAYAGLDRTNLQLKYQQAQSTAGTSAGLAASMSDLKRAVAPMSNDVENLKNIVGIVIVKKLTQIVGIMELAINVMPELKLMRAGINLIAGLMAKEKEKGGWLTFLDRVQSGEFVPNPPPAAKNDLAAKRREARGRRAARRLQQP